MESPPANKTGANDLGQQSHGGYTETMLEIQPSICPNRLKWKTPDLEAAEKLFSRWFCDRA
jgi:hypothetical protein